MIWVVDTCVLIDLLKADSRFAKSSAAALQSKLDDVLMIAPITYVELAPAFNGDIETQDRFLDAIWVRHDFHGDRLAMLLAHKSWYEHILRKRLGSEVKRPIADVIIGAYALAKGGLITRNVDDFRSLYPTLRIYNPIAPDSAQEGTL